MDAASLGALFGLSRGGLPSPCPSERHGGEIIQKGPPLPHFLTPLIKRRLKCAQGLRETAHFEILGNRSGEAAPNENDMRPPWKRTSTRPLLQFLHLESILKPLPSSFVFKHFRVVKMPAEDCIDFFDFLDEDS